MVVGNQFMDSNIIKRLKNCHGKWLGLTSCPMAILVSTINLTYTYALLPWYGPTPLIRWYFTSIFNVCDIVHPPFIFIFSLYWVGKGRLAVSKYSPYRMQARLFLTWQCPMVIDAVINFFQHFWGFVRWNQKCHSKVFILSLKYKAVVLSFTLVR